MKNKLPIYELKGTTAVIGDIHGNPMGCIYSKPIVEFKGVKNLIFLGDIGFGFLNEYVVTQLGNTAELTGIDVDLDKFHEKNVRKSAELLLEDIYNISVLITRNKDVNVFLIRGNHDDPRFWSKKEAKAISKKFPKITMLPDCFLKIDKNYWYAFGGATSIDANCEERIDGITFWKNTECIADFPGEDMIPEEITRKNFYGILSHTGPCPVKHYKADSELLKLPYVGEQLSREKEIIIKYLEKLAPARWYYGHFHETNREKVYKTICHVVGICEVEILPRFVSFKG